MWFVLVPAVIWLALSLFALIKVNSIVKKYKNMKDINCPKEWAGLIRRDFNNWDVRSMRIGCFLRFPFHLFLLITVNFALMFMVLLIQNW